MLSLSLKKRRKSMDLMLPSILEEREPREPVDLADLLNQLHDALNGYE